MAAINFPSSPTLNDIHSENNLSWKWNGVAWVPLGKSGYVGDLLSLNNLSDVSSASAAVTNLTTVSENALSSITLSDSDSGKILVLTSANTISVEVPSGLMTGFNALVIQNGSGVVTFSPGAGATLNSYNSLYSLAGIHSSASVIRTAASTYNLAGNLV